MIPYGIKTKRESRLKVVCELSILFGFLQIKDFEPLSKAS